MRRTVRQSNEEVNVTKRIILAGLLGTTVMVIWAFLSFAVLRIGGQTIKPVPDQAELHAALKSRITQPGTYACLYVSSEREMAQFPNYLNEPVYAITYKGYTHSTVPGFRNLGVLSILFAPVLAAWLLTKASESVLKRYATRVLFVMMLGLFVAMAGDWPRAVADEQQASRLLLTTANTIVTWLLAGLAIAWRIRPEKSEKQSGRIAAS
jgi:hypothetical protein